MLLCLHALYSPEILSIIGDLLFEIEYNTGDVEYGTEPRSVFQANVRRVMTSNKVQGHQTKAWTSDENYEKRIKAVPKESDFDDGGKNGSFVGRILACEHPQRPVISGDWTDLIADNYELLPPELKTDTARTVPKNRCRFGRLMWRSHCATILTQSGFQINSNTCGPVIHPEADRVLTVRECARAQGIPDNVRIQGTLKEQYKQCGNGVPSPLAEAIGREIRKAVLEVYKRNAGI